MPRSNIGCQGRLDLRASVGNTVEPPIVELSHPARQRLIGIVISLAWP